MERRLKSRKNNPLPRSGKGQPIVSSRLIGMNTMREEMKEDLKLPVDLEAVIHEFENRHKIEDLLKNESQWNNKTCGQLLLWAAYSNDCKTAEKIFKKNFQNLFFSEGSGFTALHIAIFNHNNVITQGILNSESKKRFLDATRNGYTPLHAAVFYKNLHAVKSIVKALNSIESSDAVNNLNKRVQKSGKDLTALHIAAMKDAKDEAGVLIEAGADCDAKLDNSLHTPLHMAAICRHEATALLLLQSGASFDAKIQSKETALEMVHRLVPDAIGRFLDAPITLDAAGSEITLQVDFSCLQKRRNDCSQTMLSQFLRFDLPDYLNHPLCGLLMDANWRRLKCWYYARLLYCFVILVLVLFQMNWFHSQGWSAVNAATQGTGNGENVTCSQSSKTEEPTGFFHLVGWFAISDVLRKLVGFIVFFDRKKKMVTVKRVLTQPNNYLEWVYLSMTIYLYVKGPGGSSLSPIVVLTACLNFLVLAGEIPALGAYSLMYIEILKHFFKLIATYFFLLLGFVLSFYMIFERELSFLGVIKDISKIPAMMSGEFEHNDLFKDIDNCLPDRYAFVAHFLFGLYIIAVAIVLMNLVVGVIIYDVKKVKESAFQTKLKRKVNLCEHLEAVVNALSNCCWCKALLENFLCKKTEVKKFKLSFSLPSHGFFGNENLDKALKIARSKHDDFLSFLIKSSK